jgi:hypothetical protein
MDRRSFDKRSPKLPFSRASAGRVLRGGAVGAAVFALVFFTGALIVFAAGRSGPANIPSATLNGAYAGVVLGALFTGVRARWWVAALGASVLLAGIYWLSAVRALSTVDIPEVWSAVQQWTAIRGALGAVAAGLTVWMNGLIESAVK